MHNFNLRNLRRFFLQYIFLYIIFCGAILILFGNNSNSDIEIGCYLMLLGFISFNISYHMNLLYDTNTYDVINEMYDDEIV
jgi:hypothetical protein